MTRDKLPGIDPVGVDQLEKASQARHADGGSAALCAAERGAIQSRRTHYELPAASDDNLFGLALSGGGIRSATFALGVLQAMAGRDLFKHVDYLSTVSGGGYIGSSLLWWLSGLSGRTFGVRPYTESVPEKEWFPYGTDDPSRWRDRAGLAAGPKLLRNLKENGNYLTPGGGINIMSLIAVVLRGAILSLLFWIPPIAVLLGVLHVTGGYKGVLGLAIGLVLLFVFASLGYSLATGHAVLARRLGYKARRWTERWAGVLITVALVAALIASIDLAHEGLVNGSRAEGEEAGAGQLIAGLASTFGGLIAGLVTYFRTMRGLADTVRKLPSITTDVIAVLAAGLIIYGVLLFCHGLAVIVVEHGIWKHGLLLAVFFLCASIWVNINHISAHRMYRDRLMEAFMPAYDLALKGASKRAPAEADGMAMDQVNERNRAVDLRLKFVQSSESFVA